MENSAGSGRRHFDVPAAHPLAHVREATIDYDTGLARIVFNDGHAVTDHVSIPLDSGLVSRSTFIPAQSRMEILANGATLSMTLGTVDERLEFPVVTSTKRTGSTSHAGATTPTRSSPRRRSSTRCWPKPRSRSVWSCRSPAHT